ncbi:DUF1540 domain-containing protein [Ethanoligenens harbinense]|nr:DUF1540 domain-containing protein [Ethanoligenens harbinense YUAN-3]AYF39991.1 DUF1540 domain-containing protein [Ethanoligenens harbinense]AYF42821.1 DUF1540 domain-containing protein [Ethanoligenens harbinense]QCN93575.1 DUF1540 domain-containing protein [Ethanoligenens harbinense]
MEAPSMKVKCGVENCHYNRQNMCHANNLEVNTMSDKVSASTSDETCCSTFVDHSTK